MLMGALALGSISCVSASFVLRGALPLTLPSPSRGEGNASKLHPGEFAGAGAEGDATGALDLVAVLELAERRDRGLHEVLRAGRAIGLGQDVSDARKLEARPDALTSRDARARARRD